MSSVPQLQSRVGFSWCSRAALVVGVVIGLFAMHTLPAMAGAPSMPSMSSMATMNQPEIPTAPASSRLGSVQPTMSCGDHATCLAVLVDSPTIPALAAVAMTDLTAVADDLSVLQLKAGYARAPPEVCLVRLCISRT